MRKVSKDSLLDVFGKFLMSNLLLVRGKTGIKSLPRKSLFIRPQGHELSRRGYALAGPNFQNGLDSIC